MATEIKPDRDPTITALVSGIVNDVQTLVTQQIDLLKHEVRDDLVKTKDASLLCAGGLGVGMIAATLLAFMLTYVLWLAAPSLPLWACFGIVGGALLLIAGGLCYAGLHKFNTFKLWPNQSAQALQENVQWLTKPK